MCGWRWKNLLITFDSPNPAETLSLTDSPSGKLLFIFLKLKKKKKIGEASRGQKSQKYYNIWHHYKSEKLSGRAGVASTPDRRVAIINHSTFLSLSCCHAGIICPPLHVNNIKKKKKELWVRWLVHHLAPRKPLFVVLHGNQQLREKQTISFYWSFVLFFYSSNKKLNFQTFLILKSLLFASPRAEFKIKEAYFRYLFINGRGRPRTCPYK